MVPAEEALAAMEQPEQLGGNPYDPETMGSITAALGHKEDRRLPLHRRGRGKSKWSSSGKGPAEQRKLEKVETTGNSENEGAEEEKLGQNEPW